mgnify:CR=1 FL=1
MGDNLPCEESDCANSTEREAQECLRAGLKAGRAGNFEAGLRQLQRGKDLAQSVELFLQPSSGLAEMYSQAARWQDCVSLCQEVLSAWGHSSHHFELLQTLFYLCHAHIGLEQTDRGLSLIHI